MTQRAMHADRELGPDVTLPLNVRPVAHSSFLSYDVGNTEGSFHVGEFGDKFRRAREKKELSLDDVSNVTKISPRMLQAIEEEQFDQLPGGVFNRGFIRAYAKHLGLNSEDAVNDYLACLRQAQIDSHKGWDAPAHRDPNPPLTQPPAPRTPKQVDQPQPPVEVQELPELQLPRIEHVRAPKKEYLHRPSSRTPWLRITIAAIVLVAAFLLWNRHSRTIKAARMTATSTTAPATAPQSATAAPVAIPAQTLATAIPTQPLATTSVSVPSVTNTSEKTAAKADSTKRTSAAAPATTASNDPKAVKVEKKGDVTIRSFGASPVKASEQSTKKLTLVVRASENSWISVTSDGQQLTQETLIAPAATSFHATRELVVRVGNAAGVSFLWNGEELPPQGAESEAKTFIFDSQGMHPAMSGQAPPQD